MDRWNRRTLVLVAFVIVGALLVAPGCGKKPQPGTDVTEEPTSTTEEPVLDPGSEIDQQEASTGTELEDVFFDYDKHNLRGDARAALENNAQMLLADPAIGMTLEGHCDERGTVEYNLALGERRAQSVKDYLTEFGIDASRLMTVSYGEERPFALGHNDSSWSQNRRVHFVKR